MNSQLFLSKVYVLPENLQQEVIDFIDFLLLKQSKKPKKYPILSEEEMKKSIEAATINDLGEEYLTESEVKYYLNLKDEH